MMISIAHLGPSGTYAEAAASAYANWLLQTTQRQSVLCPYTSIVRTLRAVVGKQVDLAVVPVENSIEGSVTVTLDMLWELDQLRIQNALVLPVAHALISRAERVDDIQTVYSHPQALAQCQLWLEKFLPGAQLVPANSTTEALQHLDENSAIGAISSQRAAQLYNLPILAYPINDHPDNCTRFWVLGLASSLEGGYSSLAFSLPANVPGALLKPLQLFAQQNINLSRIESRPTKRSLGDYLFFIDLEGDTRQTEVSSALKDLENCTETLKLFGSYHIINV
ncbi:MAG: prephenate dehydratase [Cyanothece sp. SIO1E1]|nr:prephenate dehydratase [Cyanothece sp. SIO1E1]